MLLGSYELGDHHRVNEDERGGQVYRGDVAAVGADGGAGSGLVGVGVLVLPRAN